MKLAPISLDSLSGSNRFAGIDLTKWLEVFRGLVLNGLFNSSEKLNFLKQRLKLFASLLICEIVHGENFNIAFDKLIKTYGKTSFVIGHCFQAIEELDVVKNLDPTKLGSSYSLTKTFLDILSNLVLR